jgi:hypothetical protein
MPIAVNDAGDVLALGQDGQWAPAKTAQNPQTGERLAFDGQAWQPLKAGADPKYEWSDVGQAALRGVPIAGGAYESNLPPADKVRAENFDVAHPYISGAAKFAGGAASMAALLAAAPEAGALALGLRGATPLARVASSAASGAGINAADALTRGDDPGQAALVGGALGAATPAVARVAESALGGARSALTPIPKTPQNVMQVGTTPVRMTAGEISGDVNQQAFIDQARAGALGERAKDVVAPWDVAREQELAAARGGISQTAGGAVASPLEAADTAQTALKDVAAQAKAAAKTEYSKFDNMQGSINSAPFTGIANGIENQLTNAQQPMFASPFVKNALGELEQNLTRRPGMSIQEASRARELMLARARSLGPMEGYDKMVMGNAINHFDQHLENVLNSPHFTGDQAALGTLQNARQLYSQYKGIIDPKTPGGTLVNKMLSDRASWQEIANEMFGATKIGERGASVLAVNRLRDTFTNAGRPEAWQAVRQGMLDKLMNPEGVAGTLPKQAQAISQRMANFLDGGGQQMAKSMFNTQELALLKQYQQVMQRMIPLKQATNPSGTSYAMARLGNWTKDALLAAGGLHVGGPLGMIALPALKKAATSGYYGRATARQLYGAAAAPMHAPNASASPLERYAALAARAAPIGR